MKDEIATFSRYEFKYFLPELIATSIESEISHFMSLDSHVSEELDRSYFVRSQYFENDLYTNFYEKVDGMRERHKYRIRTYGKAPSNDNPIFLEKKGRKLERTMKGRIKIENYHLEMIYKRDFDVLLNKFEGHSFIEGFIFDCYRKKLKPMVIVDYLRSPYVSEYDTNFRLTFDRNIRVSLPYGENSIFSDPKYQYWQDVNAGFCTLEV
ncbi:uncharacterized protein METZ01_LOCUS255660, partial [marine metagenome]